MKQPARDRHTAREIERAERRISELYDRAQTPAQKEAPRGR